MNDEQNDYIASIFDETLLPFSSNDKSTKWSLFIEIDSDS